VLARQAKRIHYAKLVLQKELLPHVGTEEHIETRKAFFLGYTVHKLLMCALGRAEEDDRDHYGQCDVYMIITHTHTQSCILLGHVSHVELVLWVVGLAGKKRLDLAGVLLRGLFNQLFLKLCKDVKRYVKSAINEGKNFNMGQVRSPPVLLVD
jgi:DNA-directed RNA polymerase II subunit RPB2